jgi:hypothetical protein
MDNEAILTAIDGEQIASADKLLAYEQQRDLEVELGARPRIEDRTD